MNSEQVLTFLDLLDLDEEIIDSRLKTIMGRNSFTSKHLKSSIHLLQYKNLVNLREDSECDNSEECNFVAKLLVEVRKENIDDICKIVNIVLGLNKSTILSKSEHLIQQIFSNINLPATGNSDGDSEEENSQHALLNLKLCDSILDAVIRNGLKLSLPFLETPLENLLASCDADLKKYFLNNSVPKIFEGIIGYNILDRIWKYVKQLEKNSYCNALNILSCLSNFYVKQLEKNSYCNALNILSCLSNFYLPVADNQGNIQFESEIISHYEFWSILLNGLMSNNPAARKKSMYLIKRSIDSLITFKKDILVSSETCKIFNWTQNDIKTLKENWNNFFILIDSLEEKQSNIVLPSLQLFETVKFVDDCWINCAFNIGLKHDNTQVRVKCIEYRLKTEIKNLSDASVLLEALNDVNLYDNLKDYDELKNKVAEALHNEHTFVTVIKAMPYIKWSPIPLYHLSDVLSKQNMDLSFIIEVTQLFLIVTDILKIPCNNISIRHAVKLNITYFIGHCCKKFQWEHFINIYSILDWDVYSDESFELNPFINALKILNLNPNAKDEFFKTICISHDNIGVGVKYLESHTEDLNAFMEHVDKKLKKIHDINNRQYSNKRECLDDVIYVTHLFKKILRKDAFQNVTEMLSREYNTITSYIFNLVQEIDVILSIEELDAMFIGFEAMTVVKDDKIKEVLLGIYRHMIIVLTDKNVGVDKKLFAIFIVEVVTKQLYVTDKRRLFTLKQILHVMKHAQIKDTKNTIDIGRSRNIFYEKTCKIIYMYFDIDEIRLEDLDIPEDEFEMTESENSISELLKDILKELVEYVENVVECGGYGCLRWILKITNQILLELENDNSIKLNIILFIDRLWRDIEELKSNNQYSDCIHEFVTLITQDCLLKNPMYNNIILLYCSKIVEYGSLNNVPLSFLAQELTSNKIQKEYGHIVHIFSDILLFSPVPKKDHRIADNLVHHILKEPKYGLDIAKLDLCSTYFILFMALNNLSWIKDPEVLETIASIIINRIDDHFNTRQRYHENSLSHRLLLSGVQHLLFLQLLNQRILNSERISSWLIDLLGKLPHQPSVKICLEWCVALQFYVKKIRLDQSVVDMMKSKNIPLTSQFMILYWTIKHKISIDFDSEEEFKYVMDFLLSHTMGQMFNIRLHAQFLATELFQKANWDSDEFVYIMEVIKNIFIESAKDKNVIRLKEDFFINDFDIVSHFTPFFIYYFLPRYCGIGSNEEVNTKLIKLQLSMAYTSSTAYTSSIFSKDTDFKKEWFELKVSEDEVLKYELRVKSEDNKSLENSDAMGTIQKKYIPWKNMSGIDVFETGKKKEISGDLIVVASLIDKLPNLGGMARTSEVFGVKTYVVDSLRHLQDKIFQGLSVSAERWVNIEEVRPGPPLKEYLMKKKAEGYSVVAAEQTSTSVQLQQFKFPKKTLLLLGHEKEGIPCDLLPMMDQCVEIPQQGFVRSLNVHVTAAIFVWEYSRQNIL